MVSPQTGRFLREARHAQPGIWALVCPWARTCQSLKRQGVVTLQQLPSVYMGSERDRRSSVQLLELGPQPPAPASYGSGCLVPSSWEGL